LRVHIESFVWHLDVDLSYPGAEKGTKGLAVRQVKGYMSWVQPAVRQGVYYLLLELDWQKN